MEQEAELGMDEEVEHCKSVERLVIQSGIVSV